MMAHLLAPTAPATPATPLLSPKKKSSPARPLRFQTTVSACSKQCSATHDAGIIDRRSTVSLGVVTGAIMIGLNNLLVGDENGTAIAAGRRPPPKPPAEKQDPNITGLAAKILASKKRKEAMKEAVAKQRQLGKPAVAKQE